MPHPTGTAADEDLAADLLFSPAEIYHENSKLHPSDHWLYARISVVNTTPAIQRMIARPVLGYRGFPTIALPREFPPAAVPFERVLLERRSVRRFSAQPMSLPTLAKLLLLGDGVSGGLHLAEGVDWPLRTAPSGGGLFPIDLYCLPLRVDGLAEGVYYYHPVQHALQHIAPREVRATLREATYLEQTVDEASVAVVLSAVMPRMTFKYGERAYRFALLEAGHIAQNLLLAAQAEGWAAVPIGGFVDDMLNALLRLDGCEEFVVYLVLIGKPGVDPEAGMAI